MSYPPHNAGGKFSLPNIHDRIFVAIIARNFLQPGKIYVIDGNPARILTSLPGLNQENFQKNSEKSIHAAMGDLEQEHKFTRSTKNPKKEAEET